MKSNSIYHLYSLLAFLVFAALFFASTPSSSNCSGCSCNNGNGTFVTSTNNDKTFPLSIELSTLNPNIMTVTESVGGVTIKTNQAAGTFINLVAKCKDPEGVKDIQIWREETISCPDSQAGPGLTALPDASNPEKSALGSNVCSSRTLAYSFVVPQVAENCTKIEVFHAKAINFGGLKLESKRIEIFISN